MINNFILTVLLIVSINIKYCAQIAGVSGQLPNLTSFDPVEVGDEINLNFDHDEFICSSFSNEISLMVNHEYQGARIESFVCTVNMLVTLEIGSQLKSLTITYDPDALNPFEDIASVVIENSSISNLEILSISVNAQNNVLPGNLILESKILSDCYLEFAFTTQPSFIDIGFTNADCPEVSNSTSTIKVIWTPIIGAQEYDLEWSFVNSYGTTISSSISPVNLEIDFKRNSTRISTKNNYYEIPNLFEKGYLLFRVRGRGKNLLSNNHLFPGKWSSDMESCLVSDWPTQNRLEIEIDNTHCNDLNWQVTTTFAEEGKKKEVVSYFDGILKNRQTVTYLNTQKQVVAGETVYDYLGRPAINILPVPIASVNCSSSGVLATPIMYYPHLNQVNIDNVLQDLSAFHFDWGNNDCGNVGSPKLDSESGAANYYSSENPSIVGLNGYIPDANGYPYTQVEFTPDNTGRIRKQGGVGKKFGLNSDAQDDSHFTKYFYASPFQEELDRLFGSEVGYASHYQKNMVIDPNGQASISYLDMSGRTIATALSGSSPQNLSQLESAVETGIPLNISLISPFEGSSISELNTIDYSTGTIVFGPKTIGVSQLSNYDIHYNLEVDTFLYNCQSENLCINCIYDLDLILENECGQNLLEGLVPSKVGNLVEDGELIIFNTNCEQNSNTQFQLNEDNTVTVQLPIGTYNLYKVLKVNENARSFYWTEFLNTADTVNCLKTFDDFYQNELSLIDTSDCYIDCEACLASLGTLGEFIAAGGGSEAEYQEAIEECQFNCNDYINPCESALDFMLLDVTPTGQYATYTVSTNGYVVNNNEHRLSVLRDMVGDLPNQSANRHVPNNPFVDQGMSSYGYYDTNLNRTKIFLNNTNNGQPLSLTPNAPVYADEYGNDYTYPEYLTDLEDFIAFWQDGWEKSLVIYHPEWCYYQECLELGDENASHETSVISFEKWLLSIQTMDAAIANGLIEDNGTLTASNWPSMSNGDPLGNVTIFGDHALSLQNLWNNFQDNLSLPQFVAYFSHSHEAFPGYANIDPSTLTFFEDFTINPPMSLDLQWEFLRSTYLGLRQEIIYSYLSKEVINSECNGWNGCIGIGNIDPFDHPDFSLNSSGGLSTHYLSEVEPCSCHNDQYYAQLIPRFSSAENSLEAASIEPTEENIEYQMYAQTGLCPMDYAFANLLKSIALNDQLESSFSLLDVSQFTPLAYEMSETNSISLTEFDWRWTGQANTDGSLTIIIDDLDGNGSVIPCQFNLIPSEPIDWNEILDVSILQVTDPQSFEFLALVPSNDGATNNVVITGSTDCFSFGACNFGSFSEVSQLGLGVFEALNVALAEGFWNQTPAMLNTSTNPLALNEELIYTLDASTSIPIKIGFNWPFIKIGAETGLPHYPRIHLLVDSVSNGLVILDFDSDVHFENLVYGCSNFWQFDVVDQNLNILGTVYGRSYIALASTDERPLALGSCEEPLPFICENESARLWRDYKKWLVNSIENVSTNPSELVNPIFYTWELSQAMPSLADSATYSYGINSSQLTFTGSTSLGKCHNHITSDLGQNQNFDFTNITSVEDIYLTGVPDDNGLYSSFTIEALYGQNSQFITLTGTTCLKFDDCGSCSEVNQGSGEEYSLFSKTATIKDYSVEKYKEYEQAISEYNSRFGYTAENPSFITAIDFKEFFFNSQGHSTKEYAKYLSSFEAALDDEQWAKDIRVFNLQYGNYKNPVQEYLRYINAINNYNSQQSSGEITPVSYVLFTDLKCPDISWDYIQYVTNYENTSSSPLSIQLFKQYYYGPESDDQCSVKYQEYLNAYRYFVYCQSENLTCSDFPKMHRLYSLQDFIDANLCCSSQSIEEFASYIQKFYDSNTCPEGMPFIDLNECTPSQFKKVTSADCQDLFTALVYHIIPAYSSSPAGISFGNDLIQQKYTYLEFEAAGFCECISDYILYIEQTYILGGEVSQPALSIEEFCSDASIPNDCNYNEYIDFVYTYDSLIKNVVGLPSISNIVAEDKYQLFELCDCFENWKASLLAILNGDTLGISEIDMNNLLDIQIFCHTKPCPPDITPLVYYENSSATINNCVEHMLNLAYTNALDSYSTYLDSIQSDFYSKYNQHCLAATEGLSLDFELFDHHYTLYYYDQAGNLIKTVPPSGVHPLTDEFLAQVAIDRNSNSRLAFTKHTLSTTYEYNSLNQLTKQYLPDHDPMQIWNTDLTDGLPSDLIIEDVDFIDQSLGYIVGNQNIQGVQMGAVYKTFNGGLNWMFDRTVESSDILDAEWIDPTLGIGIAVGRNGAILRTKDHGVNWQVDVSSFKADLYDDINALSMQNSTEGIIAGDNGLLASISYQNDEISIEYLDVSDIGASVDIVFSDIEWNESIGKYVVSCSQIGASSADRIFWYDPTNSVSPFEAIKFETSGVTCSNLSTDAGFYLGGTDGQLWRSKSIAGQFVFESLYTDLTWDFLDLVVFDNSRAVAILRDNASLSSGHLYSTADLLHWTLIEDIPGSYTKISSVSSQGTTQTVYAVSEDGSIAKIFFNVGTNEVDCILEQVDGEHLLAVSDYHSNEKVMALSGQNFLFTNEINLPNTEWTSNSISNEPVDFEGFSNTVGNVGIVQTNSGIGIVSNQTNPTVSYLSSTANCRFIVRNSGKSIVYALFDNKIVWFTNLSSTIDGTNSIDFDFAGTVLTATASLSDLIVVSDEGIYRIPATLGVPNLPVGFLESDYLTPVVPQLVMDIEWSNNNLSCSTKDGDLFCLQNNRFKRINTYTNGDIALEGGESNELFIGTSNGKLVHLNVISENIISEYQQTNISISTLLYTPGPIGGVGEVLIGALNNKCFKASVEFGLNTWTPIFSFIGGNRGLNKFLKKNGSSNEVLIFGDRGYLETLVDNYRIHLNRIYSQPLNNIAKSKSGVYCLLVGDNGTIRRINRNDNYWKKLHLWEGAGSSISQVYRDFNAAYCQNDGSGIAVGNLGTAVSISGNSAQPFAGAGGLSNSIELNDIEKFEGSGSFVAIGNNGSNAVEVNLNPTGATTEIFSDLSSLDAMHLLRNNDHYVACGPNGTVIYKSFGNAKVDCAQGIPSNLDLNDITFTDDVTGYVVGNNGTVYKLDPLLGQSSWDNSIDEYGYDIESWDWNPLVSDANVNSTLDDELDPTQSASSSMNINAIDFSQSGYGIIGGNYAMTSGYVRSFQDLSDRYSTLFYYDGLGRIIASQNTKQAELDSLAWSYTLYDPLGRVWQAGQKTENQDSEIQFDEVFGDYIGGTLSTNTIAYSNYNNWITASGSRKQVTSTFYDETPSFAFADLPSEFEQKNLRKRVSGVVYQDIWTADYDYNHGTYYTYDIHGNVNILLQDNRGLFDVLPLVDAEEQRFKRVEYEYDLISGNVHAVYYQRKQRDQFTHRYSYDADNRIVEVKTSDNGLHWDVDATYHYYPHGPLARVELGRNHVQGVDYAYTLQGWLKGVNADALSGAHDMGEDGATVSSSVFAKDAFSFSLMYYQGDYSAIGGNSPFNNFNTSPITTGQRDLWNGNIGMMFTNLAPTTGLAASTNDTPGMLAMTYRYDQLNRLVEAWGKTGFEDASNSWTNTISNSIYSNKFSYDANGNILTQKRSDNHGQEFEVLNYQYNKANIGGEDYLYQNRLYHVNDAATPTFENLYSDDISDQGAFYLTDDTHHINQDNNYIYTQIGELKSDAAEEILEIVWRVDSKISEIKRTPGSQKQNLKFEYDAMGNRIAKHVYSNTVPQNLVSSTYYVRDASGNVMATYETELEETQFGYNQTERHIYGSNRLGIYKRVVELAPEPVENPNQSSIIGHEVGWRNYELSNHLGNVLSVITDRKIQNYDENDILVSWSAHIVNVQDYSPFGAPLKGRTWSSEEYRYGFQGQESDDDITGSHGHMYTAQFWEYDARMGRRWNTDPVGQFNSPYLALANTPIVATDPSGAWVPVVTETTTVNADKTETKSGYLSAQIEKGDNAESLAKFLSIDIEEATSLFNSMGDAKSLAVPERIAAPINASIRDIYSPSGNDYVDDWTPDGYEENYNCWESALSIAKGETPDFGNCIDYGITYAAALRDQGQFENVSSNPDAFEFGRTAIRYAVDHDRAVLPDYNETTHGAIYLGTSKDGTMYVWSKNGRIDAPKVMKQSDVIKMYGKVQGSGPTPNEGGFYNYIGQ